MKLTEGFNLLATAPDGIKRLRELILSLAVQGKLVPQDPNDEPASELLKQIRAEKQRLIAEGKVKKDKPLPEISDDEKPFALPVGWEWVRFGEILDFQGGGQPPKSKFSEVELPDYVRLIQIRDLGDKPQPVYIPRSEGSKFCSTNDIMVGRYGASVGKVFWGIDGAYNVALVKMIDEWGCFEPTFLHTLLSSPIGQSWFKGISRSAQDGFNKNDIAPNCVPLVPRNEQSRIFAKVEELMVLCDALEARGQLEAEQHARLTTTLFDALAASESAHQLQENWARLAASFDLVLDRPQAVDALEQTLLQLAVRGLLVPQDPTDEPASELLKQIRAEKDRLIAEGKIKKDKPLPAITDEEKPFELPQGWEWSMLAEVGVISPRNTLPDETEVSFVQMSSIPVALFEPHLTETRKWKEVKSGFTHFAEGDVGVAKITPCFENGKSVVFCNLKSGFGAGTTELHVVRPLAGLNPNYVLIYLKTPSFLKDGEVGMTGSAGQKRLSRQFFEENPFPLPPLAEQSRIVARVEALRTLCGQLRERLAASRQTQAHLAEALVAQT